MVRVAGALGSCGRRMKRLDRAAVFASQVVEPRDVVVGLSDGLIEPTSRGQSSSGFIRGACLAEVVERGEGDRLVVDDVQHTVGITQPLERLESAVVAGHRFAKSILAMEQVAGRVVETGESQLVALLGEEHARPIGGLERFVIATEQEQRLHACAERSSQLRLVADTLERGNGLGVVVDRTLVVAADRERIGSRTESQRTETLIAHTLCGAECAPCERQ